MALQSLARIFRRGAGSLRTRRLWIGVAAAVLVLVVAVAAGSWLAEEPLRRQMEQRLNARLQGYSVRVGALDLRPLAFGVALHDVVVTQDAQPDPPVAAIRRLAAALQWRALLRLRLVADFEMLEPAVYLDRRHAVAEARDEVPVEKRGWQDALEAIHPLHLNEFRVVEGSLTYVDQGPFPPLHLSRVNGTVRNVRKVHSGDHPYPSPVRVEAVVFDRGRLVVDGDADLLARPHPAVRTGVALEDIGLDFFRPILLRHNLDVRRGTLSAEGQIEYAPAVTRVDVARVTVREAIADYVHRPETAPKEKARAKQAVDTAQKVSGAPELVVRVGELEVAGATLGWTNRAARPSYRVFLGDTDILVRNLTNQLREGETVGQIRGRFMGSGATLAVLRMRPETDGPNFDVRVAIEGTDLRTMNPILRAHGKADVVSGGFSVYSEIRVRERAVRGYIKPLFGDVKVYDPEQDRHKGLVRKGWERLLDALKTILENVPRDEVATVVDVSGPLKQPDTSTWGTIVNLLRNAFLEAILPGFDRQTGRGRRA